MVDPTAQSGAHEVAITVGCLVTIVGIGWADYAPGPDFGVSLFYLVPILAGAWWSGRGSTVVVCLAASATWFAADFMHRQVGHLIVSVWNGTTRLAIFVLVGMVVSLLRHERRQLAEVNADLKVLLERSESLARTDELTGLANTRAFVEALGVELERRKRDGQPICIAYLDLDNFKRINDLHGHLTGDQVLREIGAKLRSRLRSADLPARLGGDEFAVLLWDADRSAAAEVGERLVRDINEVGARFPDARLGLSVGLAYFDEPPGDAEAILRAADEVMYEAKRRGKGQVRIDDGTAPQEASSRSHR